MIQELTIKFDSADTFTVSLNNQTTTLLPFESPLIPEDWQDVQWYLEIYPTQYAADVDDARAERLVAKLQVWGQSLFEAVFGQGEAAWLFAQFQGVEVEERQLSIAASQPEILRLPWELLCDPQGTFLLHGDPGVLMRRQFTGSGGGKLPIAVKPKETLRLLMVVSRPEGVRFIDPRAEAQAVIKAIDLAAPGRIVVEFLRPATLKKLCERLKNDDLPAVDILHFDGHGVFAINDKNPQGMGYLLFEDQGGKLDKISAEVLGDILQEKQVSLVMLSACESAKLATEADALGCVAARLIHCGIPAVLAMTYPVLTTTTEQLFGKFYGELAKGESMGTALAVARQDLEQRRDRGLRWRGREQITLNLSDWFLPAFYQAGNDVQLLNKREMAKSPEMQVKVLWSRFSEVAKERFFGRSQDLWKIEQLFAKEWRRFTISGFGGQGKTYLALEAGRWLYQTGMFDVLCFVDYASFQGVEPVDWAVAELSVALEQSFVDAEAVKLGLQKQRTLVILDNLESLQPEALQGLLTVASGWSEVGETRLLLTTRDKQLNHPGYSIRRNEYLLLKGLGNEEYPEDAINYFQELMKLLPEPAWDLPGRDDLIELFKLVDFHPLSIRSVAFQLKDCQIVDLTKSLQELLQDGQGSLVASLNLSLQRLSPDLSAVLPKLGMFQGGAFEDHILRVTEIAPEQWVDLRLALVRTGLVQVEEVGIPFLRFHPTLAPVLWGRLTVVKQEALRQKHQEFYYALANYFYRLDRQQPQVARIIVKRELPNLLWALQGALADQADYAMDFVTLTDNFLDKFGLKRDLEFLTKRLEQMIGAVGSNNWFLVRSNQGQQLFTTGQYPAAAEVFTEILAGLGTEPSLKRVNILHQLGRCFHRQGELTRTMQCLEAGISLSEQLEQGDNVKRQRGNLQEELGNAFQSLGQYAAAQKAYEDSLAIDKELGNQYGAAMVEGMLGTLARMQNDLATAAQKHQSALQTFQQLQEPRMEAVAWHHLGMVYEESQHWAEADRAYRQSASIEEQQGDLSGAANTYGQLANLNVKINKLTEAEDWYGKALQNFRAGGNKLGESRVLYNLAYLLTSQPRRLPETKKLAEAALANKQTLDPAAAEIWKTYNLLAKIATAQGETPSAQTYCQQARSAKAAFAGTQYELQQYELLIVAVVAAVADQAAAVQLEPLLTKLIENGLEQLVITIRRILAGERVVEALWDDLDADDSMIIQAIIDRLAVEG